MNNKYYGRKEDYAPIRQDRSAIYVSYGKEDVDDMYCTWYELCYYKKQYPKLTFKQIKQDIISDIDEHTKENIISGFIWNEKPVWLSLENQSNFSTAEHRAATSGDNLPHKEKIGEREDGTAIYHIFKTAEEFTTFWKSCQDHIDDCRKIGWQLKDSIDWSKYQRESKDDI